MSAILTVVLIIVILAVATAAVFIGRQQARTRRLRRRFGPEYERVMRRHGDRAEAERELMSREQRHQELDLHALDPRRRELYQEQWTHVQEQFVDTPEAAVEQADRLVTTVMGERGYPTRDFEDRAAHLSVEHGRLLDQYRRGHEISGRAARREASTEDLRQAMVHYRALFEDLLAAPAKDGEAARAPGRHAKDEHPKEEKEEEEPARAENGESGRDRAAAEAEKVEAEKAEAEEEELRRSEEKNPRS